MKKIPVRVIVIVVVLILLALCFFRKEGYDLTPEQSERLTKMFDDYDIPMNDRRTIRKYITDFPVEPSSAMEILMSKNADFMNKFDNFMNQNVTSPSPNKFKM